MAVSSRRSRKTIEDYLALPDGVRAELIGGELHVTPAPTPRHGYVVHAVHTALEAEARRSAGGVVHAAPVDVVLSSRDVVQPDVFWIPADRRDMVQDRILGAPALVVEVLSPAHPERDRIVKRDLYARNGVPEYWLVDLDARSVDVLRLEGPAYVSVGRFTAGEHVVSPSLPGLRASVDELFRDPWAAT